MPPYDRKDYYYRKAKQRGLPSRATFKLEEILSKFPLVAPGDTVLDLGAAPGGWTVQLAKAVGPQGRVLALDFEKLKKVQGPQILFHQGDIFQKETQEWLREISGKNKINGIFSDMSPKLSGIPFRDAYLSYELGLKALELTREFLKEGGNFVVKIFPGEEFPDFLKNLRENFKIVKRFEPQSTRKTSKEIYLVGMGYKKN